MKSDKNLIAGIDEVGRGPLAGPVSVCIFISTKQKEKELLKKLFGNNLKDSKKLTPKKREEIYKKILYLKNKREVEFSVSHISNKFIDKNGINKSINKAIEKCFSTNTNTKSLAFGIRILLDGGLKAPTYFKNQKTIIKGDEKNIFIACASIIAKVERDKIMDKLSKKYRLYQLGKNKGYGTKKHIESIKINGLSNIHRKTFCKNIYNLHLYNETNKIN